MQKTLKRLNAPWQAGGEPEQSSLWAQILDIEKEISALAEITVHGGVAERLNAPVLKTGVPKGTGGSNPSSSAKIR